MVYSRVDNCERTQVVDRIRRRDSWVPSEGGGEEGKRKAARFEISWAAGRDGRNGQDGGVDARREDGMDDRQTGKTIQDKQIEEQLGRPDGAATSNNECTSVCVYVRKFRGR